MIKQIYFSFFILLFPVTSLCSQTINGTRITLSQVYELAEKNNQALKESFYQAGQAREAIAVAESQRLPLASVSLDGSYIGNQQLFSRDFSERTAVSTPHWGNTLALDVSVPLYAGGAIRGDIRLKKLEAELAVANHNNNRQEIRFLLTDYFLYFCRLRNEEIIYRQNREQSLTLLSEMRARYKAGTALRSDITRYELRLKDIELELEQIENQCHIVNYRLNILLGLPPENLLLPEMPRENEEPLPEETEWQQHIFRHSSLIQAARTRIGIIGQQRALIQSQRRPSLTLWASENLRGPITTALPPVDQNLNAWQVGLSLRFNLSSLYTTRSKLRKIDFAIRQSEAALQHTIEKEQTEINESYRLLSQSVSQYEVRKEYKVLADENYRLVNERYLHGLAIISEMLDAGNEQLSAQLKLVNKQIEIYYNYYKLKKIAGLL